MLVGKLMPASPFSHIIVANLELLGTLKKQSYWSKTCWRILHHFVWENGLVGKRMPTNMAAVILMYGDFLNSEQPITSCIYWFINLKLAEWGYLHCVKILLKKFFI